MRVGAVSIGLLGVALVPVILGASPPGLKGTAKVRVFGGVAGSKPVEKVGRVTFAVAPVVDGKPAYAEAIFVTANDDGSYLVSLAPGQYWIGPPAKARDPRHYIPRSAAIAEQLVTVTAEDWTHLDLIEVGRGPLTAHLAPHRSVLRRVRGGKEERRPHHNLWSDAELRKLRRSTQFPTGKRCYPGDKNIGLVLAHGDERMLLTAPPYNSRTITIRSILLLQQAHEPPRFTQNSRLINRAGYRTLKVEIYQPQSSTGIVVGLVGHICSGAWHD